MVLLPHGPEPCASANSAIPAARLIIYHHIGHLSTLFLNLLKIFFIFPKYTNLCYTVKKKKPYDEVIFLAGFDYLPPNECEEALTII